MSGYAGSAEIRDHTEAGESGNETASPRARYEWEKDAFGCFNYWREWKGLQVFRSRIIQLLKARAAG